MKSEKLFVSSIRKRGMGYEIEISSPVSFLRVFNFIIKKLYFCNEFGCFCRAGDWVSDKHVLKLLIPAYRRAKKLNDV
jgi:hypothetical protein